MLNIDTKVGNNTSDLGKFFAEEFNLFIDEFNGLVAGSGDHSTVQSRQIVKAIDDLNKGNIYRDIGTENNIVLSRSESSLGIENYNDGMTILFIPKFDNTSSVGIEINGLGTKSLKLDGVDLVAGNILKDNIYMVKYSNALDAFELFSLNNVDISGDPVKTIFTIQANTNIDPNNTTNSIVLTQHANCPDAISSWYIYSIFDGTPGNGSNRSQIAFEYNPDSIQGYAKVYMRNIRDGVIQPWSIIGADNTVTSTITDTIKGNVSPEYDTLKKQEDIIKNIAGSTSSLDQQLANKALVNGDNTVIFKLANPQADTDGVNKGFVDSFFSYATKNLTEDPTDTTKELIVSSHANTPDSNKEWYILTNFIGGNRGSNTDRAQFAIESNPELINNKRTNKVYVRVINSGIAYEWNRVDNIEIEELLNATFVVSDTAPTSPSLNDIWLNSTTGSLKMYGFNGTNNIWLTLQEDTLYNVPDIVIDEDMYAVFDSNLGTIEQEYGEDDFIRIAMEGRNSSITFDDITINGNIVVPGGDGVLVTKTITQFSMGTGHSAVVTSDGSLYVAGYNIYGELGLGDSASRSSWVEAPVANVAKVECGNSYTIILLNDGRLFACGRNLHCCYGGIPDGVNMYEINYNFVYLGIDDATDIFIGNHGSACIRTNGELWVTGYNANYQLGVDYLDSNGDCIDKWTTTNLTDVVKASLHSIHSLALKSDGSAYGTGNNGNGALGSGGPILDAQDNNGLVHTWTVFEIGNIIDIACGYGHSIALTSTQVLLGTGKNNYYQLGLGHNNLVFDWKMISSMPVAPVALFSSIGIYSILILGSDDILYATSLYNEALFLPPAGQVNWKATVLTNVSSGIALTDSAMYIDTTGKLMVWGDNDFGKFGKGDELNVFSGGPIESPLTGPLSYYKYLYPVQDLPPETRTLAFTATTPPDRLISSLYTYSQTMVINDIVLTGISRGSVVFAMPDGKLFALTERLHDADSLVTPDTFNRAVEKDLGSNWEVMDWYDLIQYTPEEVLVFLRALGINTELTGTEYSQTIGAMLYNGSAVTSGNYAYFSSYHNHLKPSTYYAVTHYDNYLVSLGRWYGQRRVLAKYKHNA